MTSEGELKKRIDENTILIGPDTRETEIICFEDLEPIIDEAKKDMLSTSETGSMKGKDFICIEKTKFTKWFGDSNV
jgi:hypothetical protein